MHQDPTESAPMHAFAEAFIYPLRLQAPLHLCTDRLLSMSSKSPPNKTEIAQSHCPPLHLIYFHRFISKHSHKHVCTMYHIGTNWCVPYTISAAGATTQTLWAAHGAGPWTLQTASWRERYVCLCDDDGRGILVFCMVLCASCFLSISCHLPITLQPEEFIPLCILYFFFPSHQYALLADNIEAQGGKLVVMLLAWHSIKTQTQISSSHIDVS